MNSFVIRCVCVCVGLTSMFEQSSSCVNSPTRFDNIVIRLFNRSAESRGQKETQEITKLAGKSRGKKKYCVSRTAEARGGKKHLFTYTIRSTKDSTRQPRFFDGKLIYVV